MLNNIDMTKINDFIKRNSLLENEEDNKEINKESNLKTLIAVLQKPPKKRTDADLDVIFPFAKNADILQDQVEDADMSDECIKVMSE